MVHLLPAGPYPGDMVIPDAVMVYDQTRLVQAPPEAVWPWILQVGKGRGGCDVTGAPIMSNIAVRQFVGGQLACHLEQWYTPASWERFLPQSSHSSRSINQAWQRLKPGDKVDDYGFSPDDYFIVSEIIPEKALIYKSDRYGAHFSWSLILHEVEKGQGQSTLVHLRFRGKVAAAGLKRRLLVWGGGVMDHLTTAPMLAGLAERAEASCDDRTKKSI